MSTYKRWAPKCALPGCINLVGYHNHKSKSNSFKWKMVCEYHRKTGKAAVDKWKMDTGCENKDFRHGFLCTSHITAPNQLEVNHRDGNRHNQNPENLEILCGVCHRRVTLDNQHHKTRYSNQVILDTNLFEF